VWTRDDDELEQVWSRNDDGVGMMD
jgi:hypothetical protein